MFIGVARQPVTGGERYTASVVDRLHQDGWSVIPVAPEDLPPWARGRVRGQLATNVWLARQFASHASEAVVVQDYFWHPRTFLFNWLVRLRGGRLVCIVHHLYHDLRPNRWIGWADRLMGTVALAAMHRIVVNSANTADAVVALGIPRSRLVVIPPGVAMIPAADVQRPRVTSPVRLLAVGNVDRRKGLHHLIGAVARLSQPVTLDIVGREDYDPSYRAELGDLVERLGVADRVTFRGRLGDRDLARAYEEGTIFVVPSLWEGFGIALLEAMLHGLPIVGTDVGAIPELIRDGESGLLVPPGDPAALAAAIDRLLTDASLAGRLGTAARARGLEVAMTWDAVGDAVVGVVNGVAAR